MRKGGGGEGGCSFLEAFDEKIYGHSLSIIFLEDALKRQSIATETEIK